MIACTRMSLPGTVTRTCSARVHRRRTSQSAAMNFDGSVSGSYQKGLGMNRFKNKPSRCPIGSAGPSPIPFFDLGRPLRFGLCVADSFGEHVAKFSLRLRRFSRVGFLPLGHERYVGMPQGKVNPGPCPPAQVAKQCPLSIRGNNNEESFHQLSVRGQAAGTLGLGLFVISSVYLCGFNLGSLFL